MLEHRCDARDEPFDVLFAKFEDVEVVQRFLGNFGDFVDLAVYLNRVLVEVLYVG